MSAGFTPGPWTLGADSKGLRDINALNQRYPHYGIAAVVTKMEADVALQDWAEGEANARLIAAAPELYEALEGMVSRFGHVRQPQVEAARAALSKARGEQVTA